MLLIVRLFLKSLCSPLIKNMPPPPPLLLLQKPGLSVSPPPPHTPSQPIQCLGCALPRSGLCCTELWVAAVGVFYWGWGERGLLQRPAERPFTATALQLGEITDSCEDVMTGRLHSTEECHHSDVCRETLKRRGRSENH